MRAERRRKRCEGFRKPGGFIMTRAMFRCGFVMAFVLLASGPAMAADEAAPASEESFYSKSLHYTNRGIEFLYSKEQGGLERLTGIPAAEMGCLKSKCHVQSCDTCHREAVGGKAAYSVKAARSQEACKTCHPVEKDDPDAHFRRGMKCMDCHSARDIHGDGTLWNTYMQPGALDARCETCHATISRTISHTVHGGKLDCSTCHALEFITCFNCHVDTRLKGGKDASIERRGLFFLVNHDGKVTLANVLSYVYGKGTMITVAPYFPHSVTRQGRACDACHASAIVAEVKAGTLVPFMWKDGEASSVRGVIPVVEGMKWNLAFLGRDGDRWVPLADPAEPLVNFSGYCTPLSREQLARLERAQRAGPAAAR